VVEAAERLLFVGTSIELPVDGRVEGAGSTVAAGDERGCGCLEGFEIFHNSSFLNQFLDLPIAVV
jgi:hypothetical protein